MRHDDAHGLVPFVREVAVTITISLLAYQIILGLLVFGCALSAGLLDIRNPRHPLAGPAIYLLGVISANFFMLLAATG